MRYIIYSVLWLTIALAILFFSKDSQKKDIAFWSCLIISNIYIASVLYQY